MQLIMALFYLPLVAARCRTVKFFKEEGVALQNHVIKTVTDSNPISCGWQCADTPLCFSMNVRRLPNGWVTCELNNSSRTADPRDLISSPGSHYYEPAEVEHCTAEQCVYKEALPDGWYRHGSKLLKLFHERKTWGQARQFCHSIGGELASIDQENENSFIFHLLNQIKPISAGKNVISRWLLDGSDVDISLFNGARYEEDIDSEKALYLDGLYAYATTPAVNFVTDSFTLASWVKLQSPVKDPSTIFGYWSDPYFLRFSAYIQNGLQFQLHNHKIGQRVLKFRAGTPKIDEWFHAAAVWNRGKRKTYLYLNGQEIGRSDKSNTIPKNFPATTCDIGLKRGSNDTTRGYLKNLMIVGAALTSEEIINMTDSNNEAMYGVWTGLNDITTEDLFHRPNGSQVTYERWSEGQPDNAHEYQNCVQMKVNDGTWDDESCGKRLPFLCEKKP